MQHRHSTPDSRGRDINGFTEFAKELFNQQLRDLAKVSKVDFENQDEIKGYLATFLSEFKNANPRFWDVIDTWIKQGEIK